MGDVLSLIEKAQEAFDEKEAEKLVKRGPQELTLEEAIQIYQDTDASEKRLGVTKDSIATVDLVRSLDGEQSFFEDHKRLESFRSDPVVAKAAEQLHMELKRTMPQQGMTMGGIT